MRTNLKTTIEVRADSQVAFAKQAGIHPVRLNRIVNGWIAPSPVERDRFAELLNVDAAWLFRIVTIPTGPNEPEEVSPSALAVQIDGIIEIVEAASKSEKL